MPSAAVANAGGVELAERVLRISCLPVGHGDSILIEYGDPTHPARVLIDGRPANRYPALQSAIGHLPAGQRRFELLVSSHIDADHIDGALILLQDQRLGISELAEALPWSVGRRPGR